MDTLRRELENLIGQLDHLPREQLAVVQSRLGQKYVNSVIKQLQKLQANILETQEDAAQHIVSI